jgi:predicted nucleotidyltransferase
MPVSTRAETIEVIRANADAIRRLGATALYLYGSAARDEIGPESDVDVFIDYVPDGSFTFVELIDIGDLLQGTLGREVDVTTRDGLHPRLRERIEAASLRII